MAEHVTKWYPVPDVTTGFGWISFSKSDEAPARRASIVMHGDRQLSLAFTRVIALRYEDECPGYDPIPKPLPMLRERVTFPLLIVQNSRWRDQWLMHSQLVHYVLISSDDLVQLVADAAVEAHWVDANAV
jgi:hypothetical protein